MRLRLKSIRTITLLAIVASTLLLSGCEKGREHQITLENIRQAAEDVRHRLKIEADKARDIAIAAEQEAARITIAATHAVEQTKQHGITMNTLRHVSPFVALAAVLMSAVWGFVTWRKAYYTTRGDTIRRLAELFEENQENLSAQERMVLLGAIGQGSATMSGVEYKPVK